MTIDSPVYKQLVFPSLDASKLPEGERRNGRFLSVIFMKVAYYIRDFESALDLFDHCENLIRSQPKDLIPLQRWMLIAAREGAITFNNFGWMIEHAHKVYRDCPTILSWTIHDNTRAARRVLLEDFPKYRRVRHAVAHAAELMDSMESFNRSGHSGSAKDGDAYAIVEDSLAGRYFMKSHGGEIIGYDLSRVSLLKMADVANLFFSAFTDRVQDG